MVKKRPMTSTEILKAGSFGQIIKACRQPLKGKFSDVIVELGSCYPSMLIPDG